MEDERETSREQQLRAGAEPTAAEQMAVEMGGEGDMDDDEGPSPITTAINITSNTGAFLTYVPVKPAFGIILQSIATSELGARRAQDILMGDDNPEATMSFERLTTTMNNLFGDQIAWDGSIATPQSTYSTARSAQVVFKCLMGQQVPSAVMVVSKMRCTREDLARCPINDNNFPPRITVDGSPYIFSLNTQMNYWTAGGEEDRLAPSAYRTAVYECYRNESERSEAMNEAGAFFMRYVSYYDETQGGRSAQDILSEEGDAMAASEVANRGSGEVYVQNINVFEQIPALRTYVDMLPNISFKLGLVRTTYFLRAIGYSRERVIDALAFLSEQGYMLRNVYTPPPSEYDAKPHFTAVLEAKAEGSSLEMLPSARIAFATKLSGQSYNEYFSGITGVRSSGFFPPSSSRPRQMYDVALPFWYGMEDLSREDVARSELQIREASARVYTEDVVTGSVQPDFGGAGRSLAVQTTDTSTETPRPRLANLPSQAPTFGAGMARRLDTLIPRGQYVLIGYQRAASQMLFRSGELEVVRSGAERRVEMSYIFYFAKQGEGSANQYSRIQFYQSEFGPLPAGNYKCDTQEGLDRIFDAMRNTGRLSNVDQLQIKPVPLLIKKKLRKYLKFPAMENRFEPQRSQALFERLQLGYVLPFNDERRILLTEWIGEADRASAAQGGEGQNQNDQLASGTSVPNVDTGARQAANIEAIKTRPIDRTIAYEIEGNWVGSGSDSSRVSELKKKIKEVLYEKYEPSTREEKDKIKELIDKRYQVSTSASFNKITLKRDGSVTGTGIAYGDGFETDTPVLVPPRVDLAKTNANEGFRRAGLSFNEYKFKTEGAMWQWSNVFTESLLRSGVRIHKSSGLHIHVSTSDYTQDDKIRYLENYAGFEPLLDLMMPVNSRKGGRSYNASIIQQGEITTGYQRGNRTPDPSPNSWRRSGNTGRSKVRTETGINTLEFRHTMTSVSSELIKHMCILAYSLVEVSKIHQFTSFKFKDLEKFVPETTATFLYNRIEELAQPDVDRNFFVGERGTDPELNRRNLN
jgi:hypothetical protein